MKYGWATRSDGYLTYTVPGHSWATGERAPTRVGWDCFFVSHVGVKFTRWTYRPVGEPTDQDALEYDRAVMKAI